ncbi:MAG: HEPN domain-containing protein [Acidobacteria bacterium]|nr:HEPN domain-containing protein [Acidobacteriota bacterium]
MATDRRDALLDDFALRCFRDIADGDYIAARMAYRAQLFAQAHWASQQALEKYVKAVLLFRRIPREKPTHSLQTLLRDLEAVFPLRLRAETRSFIEFIEDWNVDRYFIYPYVGEGIGLIRLDMAVWDVRRYCLPIARGQTANGTPLAELDLRRIERAVDLPPHRFKSRCPGALEKILADPTNAARPALVYKNLYFGAKSRQSVALRRSFSAFNSPLSLHPELLDELRKYVYLPPGAVAFRKP